MKSLKNFKCTLYNRNKQQNITNNAFQEKLYHTNLKEG